ncbi:MAG: 3-hydroxybutyryl-CoA dehydrogenase [Chloroflexi bacterium]|nr:3-hydroxybutyryl-CoA dehydrogenase [Chloroflexota bacterium]
MQIETIALVGAGQLGSGIAQVGLTSGFKVVLRDISNDRLNRSVATIRENLAQEVGQGRMTAGQGDEVLSRLSATTDLRLIKEAQVVIEAVFERMEVKRQVLVEADSLCPAETILASNTSSIPITKLASVTKRPDRVIGMHFVHPVLTSRGLEVVPGYLTSPETRDTIIELGKALGRRPIRVSRDYAGFANVYCTIRHEVDEHSLVNELLWQIMEGKRTPQEIEASEKVGPGSLPPLAYLDFVGLDTWLNISNGLHDEYGLPRLHPCPLLRRLVEAGHLGVKTGIGFYDYSRTGRKAQELSKQFLEFVSPLLGEVAP